MLLPTKAALAAAITALSTSERAQYEEALKTSLVSGVPHSTMTGAAPMATDFHVQYPAWDHQGRGLHARAFGDHDALEERNMIYDIIENHDGNHMKRAVMALLERDAIGTDPNPTARLGNVCLDTADTRTCNTYDFTESVATAASNSECSGDNLGLFTQDAFFYNDGAPVTQSSTVILSNNAASCLQAAPSTNNDFNVCNLATRVTDSGDVQVDTFTRITDISGNVIRQIPIGSSTFTGLCPAPGYVPPPVSTSTSTSTTSSSSTSSSSSSSSMPPTSSSTSTSFTPTTSSSFSTSYIPTSSSTSRMSSMTSSSLAPKPTKGTIQLPPKVVCEAKCAIKSFEPCKKSTKTLDALLKCVAKTCTQQCKGL